MLVARPALDDAELARVVERDVDRAVAAFREARDHASLRGRDRAVARVHRADEVARHEGRPALAAADAVRPFLVREGAGRPVRHHEDRCARRVPTRELVDDDAHPQRLDERERPPREAVQEVDHRVAAVRRRVTRRQVRVDGLAAAAERRARDREPILCARLRHPGRIAGRREAPVEPVVEPVVAQADRPHRQEGGERGGSADCRQSKPADCLHRYVGCIPVPFRLGCGCVKRP